MSTHSHIVYSLTNKKPSDQAFFGCTFYESTKQTSRAKCLPQWFINLSNYVTVPVPVSIVLTHSTCRENSKHCLPVLLYVRIIQAVHACFLWGTSEDEGWPALRGRAADQRLHCIHAFRHVGKATRNHCALLYRLCEYLCDQWHLLTTMGELFINCLPHNFLI